MMKLLFMAFAAGCASSGSGDVVSAENAPWSMNGASIFLFTPGPDNDGEDGYGTLTIATNGTVSCAMVAGADSLVDSGLSFEVGYFTGRKPGSSPPAWNGLYATGETRAAETVAHRTLVAGGWHQGFEYAFAGQDAWVEVTRGAQGQFAGRFATQWWSGDFDAQMCEKERPAENETEEGESE